MTSRDLTYENQLRTLRDMIWAEWEEIDASGLARGDREGAELGLQCQSIKTRFGSYLACPPEERQKFLTLFSKLLASVKKYSGRLERREALNDPGEKPEPPDSPQAIREKVGQAIVHAAEKEGDAEIGENLEAKDAGSSRSGEEPGDPAAGGRKTIRGEPGAPKPPAIITVTPPAAPPPPPEPVPLENLSELLPKAEGPVVYFRFKAGDSDHGDGKPIEWLKRRIDQAPPLLGDVGKEFEYRFELGLDKSHRIVAAEGSPELTEKIGLAVFLDEGDIVLKGVPAGGFDGKLWFSFAGLYNRTGGELHDKPMFMAPDPRTLWENLPVADYEGYPAPDEAVLAVPVPGLAKLAVAASCRGRSHAHAAKPRDDYFCVRSDPDTGWSFAAVADGAGSARYSRKGAELACETAVGMLRDLLAKPDIAEAVAAKEPLLAEWKKRFTDAGGCPDPAWEDAFRDETPFDAIFHTVVYSSHMAIREEAKRREAQVKDYHTTLLVAALRKFSFGHMILSYWLGDGGMAVYDWNGKGGVLVPGSPDGGEFAGQTRFLTMTEEIDREAIRPRVRFCFADEFGAFIQMTDGVADPFFPAEKDVVSPERWRHFWEATLRRGEDGNPGCPELFDPSAEPDAKAAALRRWLDFWSKGNHDDRTILIIQ